MLLLPGHPSAARLLSFPGLPAAGLLFATRPGSLGVGYIFRAHLALRSQGTILRSWQLGYDHFSDTLRCPSADARHSWLLLPVIFVCVNAAWAEFSLDHVSLPAELSTSGDGSKSQVTQLSGVSLTLTLPHLDRAPRQGAAPVLVSGSNHWLAPSSSNMKDMDGLFLTLKRT